MIQVSSISKSYGTNLLFNDASFSLERRERVGIIGRNGHGKSTLFRLILGQEEPDEGRISIPRGYRIGHLPQTLLFTENSVLAEACLGLPESQRNDASWRAERILMGLGFEQDSLSQPPSKFSGGWQIRINLAKLLLSDPDLLLLDEPTNYLDIVSVRWLQRELNEWRGELMLISHDRDFMDSITTHTLGIHRYKIRKANGGTRKLEKLIAQDEETYDKTRINTEKRREEIQEFIDRFRAKASKATLVQSRVKALQKMEQHEALSAIENLSFVFTQKPFSAPSLGRTKDLSFRYSEGPLLIQGLSITITKDARIGIIGKNGRGKSTLLKLLAQEIQPLDGLVALHEATSIGYFGQTNISRLNDSKRIEEEIQDANPMLSRTKVRAICGAMLFGGDDGDKKIGVLSGGEKSRVLLGRILATPVNLLLLDEPTSHLDMESIEALIDALKSFSGGIAVVTHSETVLRALCTSLIVFTANGVEFFPGSYDEFLTQKGWGTDEQESIAPSKSSNTSRQKKDKNDEKKQLNPLKKKQLEAEFVSLDNLLKNNTKDIEKAGLAGDFELLQHLSDDREKYESRQLEILDLLAE